MPEVIWRYVRKPCVDKARAHVYSLEMVQAPFFQQIDQRIKQCCHNTEQDDAHKEPIHFKQMRRHSDMIYRLKTAGRGILYLRGNRSRANRTRT